MQIIVSIDWTQFLLKSAYMTSVHQDSLINHTDGRQIKGKIEESVFGTRWALTICQITLDMSWHGFSASLKGYWRDERHSYKSYNFNQCSGDDGDPECFPAHDSSLPYVCNWVENWSQMARAWDSQHFHTRQILVPCKWGQGHSWIHHILQDSNVTSFIPSKCPKQSNRPNDFLLLSHVCVNSFTYPNQAILTLVHTHERHEQHGNCHYTCMSV